MLPSVLKSNDRFHISSGASNVKVADMASIEGLANAVLELTEVQQPPKALRFSHPAIESLCISIVFKDSKNCLYRLDSKSFEPFPSECLAMAAVAVCRVLVTRILN